MKIIHLVALSVCLPAFSAMADSAKPQCEIEPCPAPVTPQGSVAFIDPETGELLTGDEAARASGDEARALFTDEMQAQMRAAFDPEGLSEVRTETGAVAINLQGRFQSPYVAYIRPNGISVGHSLRLD